MNRTITINTAVLMREPGRTKHIDVALPADDLGIDDTRITAPIAVDLAATSSLDAIHLGGTITVNWRTGCRRCATIVDGSTIVAVDELYQRHPDSDDVFPIEGDQIDIAPIVRQYTLLELPDDVLCREDCAGLCAQCGADQNGTGCECVDDDIDPRWAALSDLQLDPDE